MSNVHKFEEWDEFLQFVFRLREPKLRARGFSPSQTLLFRGQENAAWDLKTTLERAGGSEFSCDYYQSLMKRARFEIQAFTDKAWVWQEQSDIQPEICPPDDWLNSFPMQRHNPGERMANVEYMTYLRHYGFPSPLLDWTRSPFIAAHFAIGPSGASSDWAIYVYDEMPLSGRIRSGNGSAPEIYTVDKTHAFNKRHFLQQSLYTLCICFREHWKFASYEDVKPPTSHEQDIVHKCIFPASVRRKVLEALNQMNVNAYSLFGTEEALLTTLASKYFSTP